MDRYARLTARWSGALEEEHGLGVSEYEVLERLATAPTRTERRMQELAERGAPQPERAVARGRPARGRRPRRRAACAHDDRRGIFACLTDAGRERYEAARPTHRGVLADTLG